MDFPTTPTTVIAESATPPRARPRWLVFPSLSLLTILIMLSGAELTARMVWPEGGTDACRISDALGRHKPNCTTSMKAPEGPWVQYNFNDCGYRSLRPCGPKPLGAVRVAVMGSSTSEGYMIPYDQMFSVVAAQDLSHFYDRAVEFQNLGTSGCWPICSYRRVDEALSLKPDLVLLAVPPFDVQQDIDPATLATRKDVSQALPRKKLVGPSSFIEWLGDAFSGSRAVLAARHFLYQDRDTYVKLYLMQSDKAGFLRQPFPPAWEKRFADLDLLLGEMADRFHAAGVPFALLAVPERAQAALLRPRRLSPGVDPYAFRDRLSQIAANHRIIFLDVFHDFARLSRPETMFYPVDSHLTPAGQSLLGHAIARVLENSGLPAFSILAPREPSR